MTTSKSQLVQSLRKRAKGTPYVIEPTDNGFLLTLNIIDETYYIPMYKAGIRRGFKISGIVNEAEKTVATTDELLKIDWQAGSGVTNLKPRLIADASIKRGEITSVGFGRTLGVSSRGKPGVVAKYDYSTATVKRWLDAGLAEYGYRRVLGRSARIAKWVATWGLGISFIVALIYLAFIYLL